MSTLTNTTISSINKNVEIERPHTDYGIGTIASNEYLSSNTCYLSNISNTLPKPKIRVHNKEEFFEDYKIPGDFIYLDKDGYLKQVAIKEMIYSDPATVVFWDDGTRTVCKAFETDEYNPESGLAMCIIKKLYGGSALKKILDAWIPRQQQFKGTTTRMTLKDARNNMKSK
jgi:hypothetical protein